MRPYRNLKIASVIEHELSNLFLKRLDFDDALVTITNVHVDEKLEEARVTVSVLPFEKGPKIFILLGRERSELQHQLLHRMNIKPMPRIEFELESEVS